MKHRVQVKLLIELLSLCSLCSLCSVLCALCVCVCVHVHVQVHVRVRTCVCVGVRVCVHGLFVLRPLLFPTRGHRAWGLSSAYIIHRTDFIGWMSFLKSTGQIVKIFYQHRITEKMKMIWAAVIWLFE